MRTNASILYLGSSAWMPAAVRSEQLGALSVKSAPNLAPKSMRPCARGGLALPTEGMSWPGGHFTKVTVSSAWVPPHWSSPSTFSAAWFCFKRLVPHCISSVRTYNQPMAQEHKSPMQVGTEMKTLGQLITLTLHPSTVPLLFSAQPDEMQPWCCKKFSVPPKLYKANGQK